MITFLSLGPGDPDLLTLKAVQTLREADVVYVPATATGLSVADGATPAAEAPVRSRAADVAARWCRPGSLRPFVLPMRRDRREAQAAYDRLCEVLRREHEDGRNAVVAVEGDVSIYASIHYVLDRLREAGLPVSQQPGIPSFIAAAAMADLSLCSQREHLVVLPGDATAGSLAALLRDGHVVVVMKLSQCAQELKDYLLSAPAGVECHYFENVGLPGAFHTADRSVILGRNIPYFALCILRNAVGEAK